MATAAPQGRKRWVNKDPVPQKDCEQCGSKMSGRDKHGTCLYCLGYSHADNAVNAPGGCRACAGTEMKYLQRRLTRMRQLRDPLLAAQVDDLNDEEPVPDWGEHMEEELPVPELELQVEDYEYDPIYVDENPFDILDEVYGDAPEDGEIEEYGDEDSHVLPAAYDAGPLAATAPGTVGEDAGGEQPAAASSAENPGVKLTVDMSDIQDIFQKAALRCNATWPVEEQAASTTVKEAIFKPLGDPAPDKPQGKGVLPAVEGFYANLQASWGKPKSCPMPDAHKLDCADMKQNGLAGLPPVDGAMAMHLLKSRFMLSGEPTFTSTTDKEFYDINKKSYNTLAAAAKTMGAALLIQGSMTAMYKAVGDAPSPEDMAEFRRLHNEMLTF